MTPKKFLRKFFRCIESNFKLNFLEWMKYVSKTCYSFVLIRCCCVIILLVEVTNSPTKKMYVYRLPVCVDYFWKLRSEIKKCHLRYLFPHFSVQSYFVLHFWNDKWFFLNQLHMFLFSFIFLHIRRRYLCSALVKQWLSNLVLRKRQSSSALIPQEEFYIRTDALNYFGVFTFIYSP